MGGNNIPFFQEYCDMAYKLLNKNKSCLDKIDIGPFNQVLDEYLFTSMVRDKKLDITYVIKDSPFDDLEAVNAAVRFNLVPIVNKYIHLLGNLKQNKYACEQLELRFEYEFPEYYKKALTSIREKLRDAFDKNYLYEQRTNRLKKVIPILYKTDMTILKKMKLRLIANACIRGNKGEKAEEKYSLIIKDPMTGKESIDPLKGTDVILAYFQTPVSIDELSEELEIEDSKSDVTEFKKRQFKILDIVTEKVMIDGLLEFA